MARLSARNIKKPPVLDDDADDAVVKLAMRQHDEMHVLLVKLGLHSEEDEEKE